MPQQKNLGLCPICNKTLYIYANKMHAYCTFGLAIQPCISGSIFQNGNDMCQLEIV